MARVDRFKQFMGRIEEAHNKGIEINPYYFSVANKKGDVFKPSRSKVCAIGALNLGTKRNFDKDTDGLFQATLLTGKSVDYSTGVSMGFFGNPDWTQSSKKEVLKKVRSGQSGYYGIKNFYDHVEGIRLGIRLHDECKKRGWLER